MRTSLLLVAALGALALLAGCGPKEEESTPAPVVPPAAGGAGAAPHPTRPGPGGAPTGPPAGASYNAPGMPEDMKAKLRAQGAPIK